MFLAFHCNLEIYLYFYIILGLTMVQIYVPDMSIPELSNRRCALYFLGFVVVAGNALRPFSISLLVLSAVECYLYVFYLCFICVLV